jgi:carboxylate-amine ligase
MTDQLDSYLAEVEARFAASVDFTVGLEEEFQILDPATLALTNRFEELRDDGAGLEGRIAGELISSEIEIATLRCESFAEAAAQLGCNRGALLALAERHGVALGATGTHPFSRWQDQRIIDTPHYRAVEDRLKYVAWRNNTWSGHVHVGVRGTDRAIAICDAIRGYLPHLLALSANSPFVESVWTQLHSARVQTFVKMFPRCGIPDAFGRWAEHRRYYELLVRTGCIEEFTQIWWAVRPHHKWGTVEVRICDVQTEPWQALAVAALAVGLIATLAASYDDGRPLPVLETRFIEENYWRAIRFGLDGKLVDFARGVEVAAPDAVRALVESVGPAADRLGLRPHIDDVERLLREGNGAQRQSKAHVEGKSIESVYAETVARVRATAGGGAAPEKGVR